LTSAKIQFPRASCHESPGFYETFKTLRRAANSASAKPIGAEAPLGEQVREGNFNVNHVQTEL
jgi:hypothetical protein